MQVKLVNDTTATSEMLDTHVMVLTVGPELQKGISGQ